MSIIQCANDCKYQHDGYCQLETISTVTNSKGGCPHYLSKDGSNSLLEATHADNFYRETRSVDLL